MKIQGHEITAFLDIFFQHFEVRLKTLVLAISICPDSDKVILRKITQLIVLLADDLILNLCIYKRLPLNIDILSPSFDDSNLQLLSSERRTCSQNRERSCWNPPNPTLS